MPPRIPEKLVRRCHDRRVAQLNLQQWLQEQCEEYVYDLRGVFRTAGSTQWPLTVSGPEDLEDHLKRHGHLLPLPKEPAALANVLEVSIVDFLLDRIAGTGGDLTARRGGELNKLLAQHDQESLEM